MGARVYGLLLRLLPRGFAEDFGDDMLAHATERAARSASPVRFWVRECASVVRVAVTERVRAAQARPRRRKGDGMGGVMREVRFAARRLLRAPGFTVTALVTLALALGAATSIWAVVKNVVVDPLPYPESDRLVVLEHGLPGVGAARGVNITEGLYETYRADARMLEAAALTQPRSVTLTGAGDAETLAATLATPGLLRVLRVEPVLGRWFGDDAGREGGAREVVLSHGLWATRFGSDADVLGRTIELSGQPWEVIGVLPRGVAYPDADVMLWLPLAEPGIDAEVTGFNYAGIGRMAEDVDVTLLRSAMDAKIGRLPELFPGSPFVQRLLEEGQLNAQPQTLKERTIGSVAGTMWVLLATVALVLLLACANVANLLLVRADARQTEIAVRHAMGAGRRGIAGQYMAETLLLAAGGGVLGVLLAFGSVALLRARASAQLPRLAEVSLDPGVVAAAAVLCLAVGLLLGLLPLLRRTASLSGLVHEAGRRTTAAAGRVRTRALLMSGQVALACVLLVACALMVRSFVQLGRVDPGFDAEGVLTFDVVLPTARYPGRPDALLFHETFRERVRGLPGVTAADVVSCAPLDGWCWGDPLVVEGREDEPAQPVVTMRRAGEDYFGAMGIDVRAGRVFGPEDVGRTVAVINRELARQYFPGEDPVGRRFRLNGTDTPWVTIIGVVDDTPVMSITDELAAPMVYFGMDAPTSVVSISQHAFVYVVRADVAPYSLVAPLRGVLRELDPNVALANVATLEQAVRDSGARIAFAMVLLSIAAATALLLGAVGIYGVLSYSVAQRTGEIGIRMALGARPGDVVGMIARQGGVPVAAGLALGLLAALGFARFMSSMLFAVEPADPLTFAAVALLLALLALAASWIPARRAAALDPVSALRAE